MSEQLKSVVNSKSLNDIPPLTRELTDSSENSPNNDRSENNNDKEDTNSIKESNRGSTVDSLPILTESSDTNSPESRCLYSNTEGGDYVKPRASSQKEVYAAKTIERYWRSHRQRHHTSA